MKAKRSFCPTFQQVEDRIVLSLSLNNLLGSLFPGLVKAKNSAPKHVASPEAIAAAKASRAEAAAARDAARTAHAAERAAHTAQIATAHPHALAHPRGIHAMNHPATS